MVASGLRPQPAGLAIAAFVAVITWIANAIHLPAALFPELGALGLVIFSDARHPWARSPGLLMLTPFLAALLGLWITRHLSYGPVAVLLDVAVTLTVLAVLRSPIVPALSAGLLPLALQIKDWSYPFAILIGTSGLVLVILVRTRLQRNRPAEPAAEQPEQPQAEPAAQSSPVPPLRQWLLPFGLFLLGALALVALTGSPLVLFPPLLVIAFEMIAHRQHCPWRGRYGRVLLVTNAAALVGLTLEHLLGVVPAAAFLAVLATVALLQLTRLFFPPALGVTLLPFVMPHPPLAYPLFTGMGSLWLVLVVALMEHQRPPSPSL
jgi:hypothetical protein